MREKEDTITALRAEVERLKREVMRQIAWKTEAQDELEDICNALPGVAFMDPPDGGSVTIAEQVRRMYAALLERDAEVRALRAFCTTVLEPAGEPPMWIVRRAHTYDLLDPAGFPTPLLTGEPGPGGEHG